MAGKEQRIHTYKEFEENILPRISKLGYNCIQFMAIHEHSLYSSFGYHVTNFFAICSRFGKPNDLKKLIDTAHKMGISIIMDLVHGHASKNQFDGLDDFDGTDGQYFYAGDKGNHSAWGSKIFDLSSWEV